MRNILEAVVIVVLFGLTFSLGFYFGEKSKQTDIEYRALKTFVKTDTLKTKTCYTQQDIELIIFNEIQE